MEQNFFSPRDKNIFPQTGHGPHSRNEYLVVLPDLSLSIVFFATRHIVEQKIGKPLLYVVTLCLLARNLTLQCEHTRYRFLYGMVFLSIDVII
jgi:hypothetical protein